VNYSPFRLNIIKRLADVFANLVFRACSADKESPTNGNCTLLKDINAGYNMYFPYKNNTLKVFSGDVYYD